MRLARLLKILWGRRLFLLTPTLATLLGGVLVIMTFPPRYEASTRVILDIIKPDPVTGFRVSAKGFAPYIASQINMLRTDDVTGRVVEAMGWLDNPDMIAAWQAAPDKGKDIRHWVGRRLSFAIGGELLPDTNILEIKFQSTSPEMAKLVADNIRTSYIEANIAQTRDSARAVATNLSAQAERERQRLVELQRIEADLERETGLMLDERGVSEFDQHAMRAARALPLPFDPKSKNGRDDARTLQAMLQNIDSSIVAAGRTLGPNNPAMIEMHRRRDFVAAQLAGAAPADPEDAISRQRLAAIEQLARSSADKHHSFSDKALAIRLVQDEIKRRRSLFDKVAGRAGYEMQISNVSDANLTPIGLTVAKPAPVFPNLALVLGGCGGLGLVTGILLAFIVEAMARRVRGAVDLSNAVEAPLLGVLPAIPTHHARRVKAERVRPPKRGRRERRPAKEPKFANA